MKEEKIKSKKKSNVIFYVLDVVILLIALYFVLGYINFYRITEDKKPIFSIKEETYQSPLGKVTVSKYGIYKIVKKEEKNVSVTYSFKLWFMKD